MPRRFQFSLRTLLVIAALVTVGLAFWLNLPALQKLVVLLLAITFILSNPDLIFQLFVEGLAWAVSRIVSKPSKNRENTSDQD